MKIRKRSARNLLWAVFVGSLIVEIALVAYARLASKIYLDDLKAILLALFAVYSIPLGIMSGGAFARSALHDGESSPGPVGVAVLLSLLWNAVLLGRVLLFAVAQSDDVDALREWIATVTASSSFLVAGALTFYFSSGEPPATKEDLAEKVRT